MIVFFLSILFILHSLDLKASTIINKINIEISGSEAFICVLNEVLDGGVSDLDLTDDEEGDPTFEVQDVQASEDEEEEEEEIEDHGNENSNANRATNPVRIVNRREYYKKSTDFWPLPAAPEYEDVPSNGINLPPHEYFFKYVPHDIIDQLCTHTNQRFLHDTGKLLNCSIEEMRIFLGLTIIMSYELGCIGHLKLECK